MLFLLTKWAKILTSQDVQCLKKKTKQIHENTAVSVKTDVICQQANLAIQINICIKFTV